MTKITKEGIDRAVAEIKAIHEHDEEDRMTAEEQIDAWKAYAPYGEAPLAGLHGQDIFKFLSLIGHAHNDLHEALFLFETFSRVKNEPLHHVLCSFRQSLLAMLTELRTRQFKETSA